MKHATLAAIVLGVALGLTFQPARAATGLGALAFSGSTDKVNYGSHYMLDDIPAGTILAWIYPTSIATNGRISQKGTLGENATYVVLDFRDTNDGDFTFLYFRATADLHTRSPIDTLVANSWQLVGVTWDSGLADGDQELYVGTLTAPVAEIASYGIQTVGSGAHTSDAAANLTVGNKHNDFAPFPGRIAWVGWWRRRLSLAEMQDQQRTVRPTQDCVLFAPLGLTGLGAQWDWSGWNNVGALTGSALADGPPNVRWSERGRRTTR